MHYVIFIFRSVAPSLKRSWLNVGKTCTVEKESSVLKGLTMPIFQLFCGLCVKFIYMNTYTEPSWLCSFDPQTFPNPTLTSSMRGMGRPMVLNQPQTEVGDLPGCRSPQEPLDGEVVLLLTLILLSMPFYV